MHAIWTDECSYNLLASHGKLCELHLNWCIIYSDNIIIFQKKKTPKEHLQRLHGVFEKLAAAGLKLKPSKYKSLKACISYLRHVVSVKGIETNLKKMKAFCNWTKPSTVTEMHSFLSFTNHYHCFIDKYAHLARPLNKLQLGITLTKRSPLWRRMMRMMNANRLFRN